MIDEMCDTTTISRVVYKKKERSRALFWLIWKCVSNCFPLAKKLTLETHWRIFCNKEIFTLLIS